ncbi:hypothetical protein [Lysinibacillus varians]|uniref:Lipoprotein n=1 Tax=Lysinibacillus varians TaxID=1145276 RepID=A0ABY2T626_9BACI|nr:hypothetical protein [Lysinibacillus varians]AHN24226.1 hypothetical protein T479_12100 [Lysinibacillus varians]TKI52682.1 hypothetical protein FC752_19055 [Lysinibacillus varians]
MRRLIVLCLVGFLLVGCAEKGKTAEQFDKGISVEMDNSQDIKLMRLIKFVNGEEVTDENVFNADNTSFKKGQIIWYDIPLDQANSTVEIQIAYSKNDDGTNEKTTEKIDVSEAKKWVNFKLNEEYHLKIIDMK